MYIQENLTTTPYEIPGISWELAPEMEEKLNRYGAFARLVWNGDRTAITDIAEDTEKKAWCEMERAKDEAREQEEARLRAAKLEAQALEAAGIRTMARSMFRAQAAAMPADEIILCRGLADEWTPGSYSAGDIRRENGVPYRCCQAHDSTENSGWNPEAAPALWTAYHGTSPDTALPWKPPTGAHDMYRQGEVMRWTDGRIMQAVQDTGFSPADDPAAWQETAV